MKQTARSTTWHYRTILVTEEPIRNQGIRTGTRFTATVNGETRQAFSVPGITKVIDDLLAAEDAPAAALSNPLTNVASMARTRVAMRGTSNLKSDLPFGG